jgi:hypothetical protein
VHETADPNEATDRLIDGAEGIVCFYDVASKQSYKQIEAIHDKIQKNTPPPFQMVLVGIVRDETGREVSVNDGDELARKLRCKFSLETKDTVGDVLDRIIRLCRQARKAQGIPWWNWRSWGCCLCWGR